MSHPALPALPKIAKVQPKAEPAHAEHKPQPAADKVEHKQVDHKTQVEHKTQDKVASHAEAKRPEAKPEAKSVKTEHKAESKDKKVKSGKLHRRSLQEYLDKAGFETTDVKLRTALRKWLLVLLGLGSIGLLMYAFRSGMPVQGILFNMVALWTVGFAALWLLIWAVIYFFLDYRIFQRTKELEEVLPDFLQLASSNISAGMPIDRALWYAIRPNFGVLAKEMEDVAKHTMAGEDLEVSLIRMTSRYDSVVLKRSINILIEGLHAGGEMADLLNKIALNIDEMKIMKKEMAASVTSYAIFITFASVVIAPILFALATELLSIIIKITASLGSTSSSMMTMASPDPSAVGNFKIFSIAMLTVLTLFSAAIVSVIKRGTVFEGIKSMPIYAGIAVVIYYIASWGLHAVMGGII